MKDERGLSATLHGRPTMSTISTDAFEAFYTFSVNEYHVVTKEEHVRIQLLQTLSQLFSPALPCLSKQYLKIQDQKYNCQLNQFNQSINQVQIPSLVKKKRGLSLLQHHSHNPSPPTSTALAHALAHTHTHT